mgnify:CR=1 FL=1
MKENKKDETGSNIKSKIEAIIFAAGQPVKISKLSQFLKIGVRQCQEILEEISQEYKNQKRGLKIIFKSGQVQMVSADIFGEDVAKFLNKELNDELSRAALEVLAVIAYAALLIRLFFNRGALDHRLAAAQQASLQDQNTVVVREG